MRCTKMHQNCSEWTKMDSIAWQSKLFQICSEWLTWSFSRLDGYLKGEKSQKKSWRGHGVAYEVHQNAPKWVKINQNGCQSMTVQTVSKLSSVTNIIFSGLDGHFKGNMSQIKCPSYPEKDCISHSGQLWMSLICHAMATILVNSYLFWCILVHLICNPMTPSMTSTDSFLLSSIHLIENKIM